MDSNRADGKNNTKLNWYQLMCVCVCVHLVELINLNLFIVVIMPHTISLKSSKSMLMRVYDRFV